MTCIMMKMLGNVFENILSVDALHSFYHRNVRIKLPKASLFLSSHDSGSSELKNSSPSSWISRDSTLAFSPNPRRSRAPGQAPLAPGHACPCCSKFDPDLKTLPRFECFPVSRKDVSAGARRTRSKVSGSQPWTSRRLVVAANAVHLCSS